MYAYNLNTCLYVRTYIVRIYIVRTYIVRTYIVRTYVVRTYIVNITSNTIIAFITILKYMYCLHNYWKVWLLQLPQFFLSQN